MLFKIKKTKKENPFDFSQAFIQRGNYIGIPGALVQGDIIVTTLPSGREVHYVIQKTASINTIEEWVFGMELMDNGYMKPPEKLPIGMRYNKLMHSSFK